MNSRWYKPPITLKSYTTQISPASMYAHVAYMGWNGNSVLPEIYTRGFCVTYAYVAYRPCITGAGKMTTMWVSQDKTLWMIQITFFQIRLPSSHLENSVDLLSKLSICILQHFKMAKRRGAGEDPLGMIRGDRWEIGRELSPSFEFSWQFHNCSAITLGQACSACSDCSACSACSAHLKKRWMIQAWKTWPVVNKGLE